MGNIQAILKNTKVGMNLRSLIEEGKISFLTFVGRYGDEYLG
jgi:hypothetical protein